MPKAPKLEGQRFGKLIILGRGVPEVSESGGSVYKTWRYRCDCGQEESVRDHRIPYCKSNMARTDTVTACSVCRAQRTCAVCSKTFASVQFRACCSDACFVMHRRQSYLDSYYRQFAADPEYNKRRAAALREKAAADPAVAERLRQHSQRQVERYTHLMQTDPEFAAQERAKNRERYAQRAETVQAQRRARRQASPELVEKMRQWSRDYYAARADEVLARRRERMEARIEAMPADEREAMLQKRRAYSAEYRRQMRYDDEKRRRMNKAAAESAARRVERMSPDELQAMLEKNREYHRRRAADPAVAARARQSQAEYRRRKALATLMGAGEALLARFHTETKSEDDDDE